MRTFFRAALDEARSLLRDPAPLVVLVGSVIVYSLLYPAPYMNKVLKRVPVAVVDLDHSATSRRLTRLIDAHELTAVARVLDDEREAAELERAGVVSGTVVIPPRFERDLLRGDRAAIGEFADASNLLTYRQLSTGVGAAAKVVSTTIKVRRLVASGTPRGEATARRAPLAFDMQPLHNPVEGYDSFIVPAGFALGRLQTLLIGIGIRGGGAREDAARARGDVRAEAARTDGAREDAARAAVGDAVGSGANAPARGGGAAPRSLVRSAAVVLGRAAVYCALYLVHVVFYFGVVCPLHGFGGAPDSAARLLVFTAPFIVSATFLGLACGAFWPRRETALQALMFTSIPAAFLAGFAWPAQAIPLWLRAPAALIPSTTGIAGLVRVLRMGASLADVAWEWGILWALAALYFSLAVAAETRRG